MKMEHRYDARSEIQKRVLIYMNPHIFVGGTTRDISYGGLSLDSHEASDLKKNAVVKVSFVVHGRLAILKAQVLRVNHDGAALMFVEQDSPKTWELNALMDNHELIDAPPSTGKPPETPAFVRKNVRKALGALRNSARGS